MKTLQKYIIQTISANFFPIFLSLFVVTSIVYLVKIAALTSLFAIDFDELLYLYFLVLPVILYYTLPITFFIAMIISFAKLSSDYELLVISSFGYSPLKLLRLILPISFFFSLSIFVISFVLIPQGDYFNKIFVIQKQQNAQFNIKASEYGQNFGPWYIYVQNKQNNEYFNITLFQPQVDKDTFIQAKRASITNNDNMMNLKLFEGNFYAITENIQQIDFRQMQINNQLEKAKKLTSFADLKSYWLSYKDDNKVFERLIKNLLFTLLPVISVLFYLAFGYYNPRYEKSRSALYGVILITFYVIVSVNISEEKNFTYMFIWILMWIFLSAFLYRRKVKPYY